MSRAGATFVPTMRRLRWVSGCVLCLALAACEQVRTQLNDVMQLGAALQTQFNMPVHINIAGGALTVSMVDQAADKLTAADRDALALSVARFAYAHYAHPDALSRVAVTFVSRTSMQPGGSWPTSALVAPSSPGPLPSLPPNAFEDTLQVTTMDSGDAGTMERSFRSMTAAQGRAVWELVVTYRRRPQTVTSVDSLRLDAATFYPVSERRHNRRGLTHLAYDGAHVHGVVDSGTTMRAVDTTFAVAPFAGAELDMVIGALPLAPGLSTTVPVFYPLDRGILVRTTVRVVDADATAWTIAVSNGPGTGQRFRIARPSRLLVDIRDTEDSVHGTSYVRR
jgi:hypothetical protein